MTPPELNPASPPANRRAIILTALAVGLFWMSLYLYVPTLSVYANTRTTDLALVGVVIAQYGLWQAIIRLPLGILSDWLGRRKPFILAGCLLAILGDWMMGSGSEINSLIVGRAVTGLAAGAWVTMTVAFGSLFPPGEVVRATALLTLVNSLFRMVSTLATGVLNESGGYPLAYTIAAVVAGLAFVLFLLVKEPRQVVITPSPKSITRLVTRRDVLLPALLSAVGQYAAYTATYTFIPILARRLGADNFIQSALTTLNLGVTMLGNLIASILIKRIGSQRLILIGFGMLALGLVTSALATQVWMVFLATILNGLASGVTYPVLMGMSIEHVQGAEKTTAMGLHQAVYAVGMFGGPWLSGILADAFGLPAMFSGTAAFIFLAGWLGIRLLAKKLV